MSTVLYTYLRGLSAQLLTINIPKRRLMEDIILIVIISIFFEDIYSLNSTKGRLKSLKHLPQKLLMQ